MYQRGVRKEGEMMTVFGKPRYGCVQTVFSLVCFAASFWFGVWAVTELVRVGGNATAAIALALLALWIMPHQEGGTSV